MFIRARLGRCLPVIFAFLAAVMSPAEASVVMNGTRVIFVGGAQEKSVSFTNPDTHANLVQVWVSREPGVRQETDHGANTSQGVPFAVTPPIFKLKPHTGQLVRLMLLPGERATDREELFYLNFSQIPAVQTDKQDANRLMLVMKSSVKLFYRPESIGSGADHLMDLLRYELAGDRLRIENPTAFHLNVNDLRLLIGDASHTVASEAFVMAPQSAREWLIDKTLDLRQSTRLVIATINDYGAEVVTSVDLGRR